jgi:hypothetical protein
VCPTRTIAIIRFLKRAVYIEGYATTILVDTSKVVGTVASTITCRLVISIISLAIKSFFHPWLDGSWNSIAIRGGVALAYA